MTTAYVYTHNNMKKEQITDFLSMSLVKPVILFKTSTATMENSVEIP